MSDKPFLTKFSRLRHALLPTPVHELPSLRELAGCRVFVKRDDLTGFGFGGNKVRKLDFLAADAILKDCDTLLAIGANQSNFCRVVAAYGSLLRMETHLVLGGKKPANPTGNLLLDHLLGADCHYAETESWQEWFSFSEHLEEKLVMGGKKVYRMPVGGSTALGCLGYVEAMAEIMEDERRLGLTFDAIVFSSSSAGTQAGLVAGQALFGWPGKIIGISAARKAAEQVAEVKRLAGETLELIGIPARIPEVFVDDGFIGRGYGHPTCECVEAVAFFAKRHGILLDYVYTGKAAAGLLQYLKNKQFGKDSVILFIHTGGNAALFA